MGNSNHHPDVGMIVLPRLYRDRIEPVHVRVGSKGRALVRLAWRGGDLTHEERLMAQLHEQPAIPGLTFDEQRDFMVIGTFGETHYWFQNWSTSKKLDRGCVCFLLNWNGPNEPGDYKLYNHAIEIRESQSKFVVGVVVPVELGHQVSDPRLTTV